MLFAYERPLCAICGHSPIECYGASHERMSAVRQKRPFDRLYRIQGDRQAVDVHGKMETSPGHELHCKFDSLMISADTPIPLGLLINELVTNAAKHAYPSGSSQIHVTGKQRGGELHVAITDQGIGLPKD